MYPLAPRERKEATTSSEEKLSNANANNGNEEDSKEVARLKRAATTALAAAAVKYKFLAKQEEDQIRKLVTVIIEKQVTSFRITASHLAWNMRHTYPYLQLNPTPYSLLPIARTPKRNYNNDDDGGNCNILKKLHTAEKKKDKFWIVCALHMHSV